MLKKYSLQEAFEKRLLENGEYVDLELLYKPYKTILDFRRYCIETISLDDYFKSRDNCKRFFLGKISRNEDGLIYVQIYKDTGDSETAELVASKLLSDDLYNIKTTCRKCSEGCYRFTIVMGPEITVNFEGDEEFPVLELPEHTAYTC